MVVPGVSMHMKKKFGKYLVGAVRQADEFLVEAQTKTLALDSFKLDIDALFGPPIINAAQVPPTQVQSSGIRAPEENLENLEWGDSDDDWEVVPMNPQNKLRTKILSSIRAGEQEPPSEWRYVVRNLE
jgi:hypothetical protein